MAKVLLLVAILDITRQWDGKHLVSKLVQLVSKKSAIFFDTVRGILLQELAWLHIEVYSQYLYRGRGKKESCIFDLNVTVQES